ncbi:MAG: NAD(P)H-hydrate epimerase [Longimicrobiales bacterium]|nr:NAD(P)H-hydrate epimerase [Longimicrobiales bacterium]
MYAFHAPDGTPIPAVTAAAMREIDRIAVEETGPELLQMMENAGRALARTLLSEVAEPERARILIMAGTGGNGGGGICAARHLAPRVRCVELVLTDPERLSATARSQLRTFRHTSGVAVDLEALLRRNRPGIPGGRPEPPGDGYDAVGDAVLGYSVRGAPRGAAADAVAWLADAAAPVISLDLPSGLDPDTGATPGPVPRPRVTVTLHLPKPGLANPVAGRVVLADLGIPDAATRRAGFEPPRFGRGFLLPLTRAGGR